MSEQPVIKKNTTKKRNLKAVLVLCLLAFAAIVLAAVYYVAQQKANSETYLSKTTVNGMDVEGLTPGEVSSRISQSYKNMRISLLEKGEISLEGALEDFGYTLDEESLEDQLEQLRARGNDTFEHLISSIFYGNKYTVSSPVKFDEEVLISFVNASNLKDERVITRDAALLQQEDGSYYVSSEVYGSDFDDAELQAYVKTSIDEILVTTDLSEASAAEIQFPEEIYRKPSVLSDDTSLNAEANAYNKYVHARVEYQFGNETEVLDFSTVQSWIIIDEENSTGMLSDEAVTAYVSDLANRYNTRRYQRVFRTTYGYDISIDGSLNEYGYTVNEEAEKSQLLSDLSGNTTVAREPVYRTSNDYGNPYYYKRNGKDDLAGTYVEVNLTAQHLWFYKDYQLVVESDFVSGSVAKNAETQTGVFPLAYKESPSTLTGDNAENGYSVEVAFWMPFYEGQGLHDATWRSSFGGNIYQTNGSHGCVNLPYWAAETIYNNISAGVAIVIYK